MQETGVSPKTEETSSPDERKPSVLAKWFLENLFSQTWDALLYLVLYIVLPIATILIGLKAIPDQASNDTALAYWYLTILISAANCFYDALGRYRTGMEMRILKVYIIGGINIFIALYGFIEALMLLALNQAVFRCDMLLLTYGLVILIALSDLVAHLHVRRKTGEAASELTYTKIGGRKE